MTKTNFDLTYSPERIYPQIGNSEKTFFFLFMGGNYSYCTRS